MAKSRSHVSTGSKGKGVKPGTDSKLSFKERLFNRVPPTADLWLLFVVCAFPVQLWAFIILFREVPALVVRFTVWDIMSIAAYSQSMALVESIGVWLVLAITAVFLPFPLLRQKLVAKGSLILLFTTLCALGAFYNLEQFLTATANQFAVWVVFYLLMIALLCYWVHQSNKLEPRLLTAVSLLSPLVSLYSSVGVISLLIIIGRNLTP